MSSPIPVCPVCRSHDVARHVQGMNVWFVCGRCRAVFRWP